MLRKLFISLLILSALTTEGIINISELLCDASILTKEVMDVVFGFEVEANDAQISSLNEKQELKTSSALFSSIKFSNFSFKQLSDDYGSKPCLIPDNKLLDLAMLLLSFLVILVVVIRITAKDILLHRSDLSPPVCIN